jgi:hypothetical protein
MKACTHHSKRSGGARYHALKDRQLVRDATKAASRRRRAPERPHTMWCAFVSVTARAWQRWFREVQAK